MYTKPVAQMKFTQQCWKKLLTITYRYMLTGLYQASLKQHKVHLAIDWIMALVAPVLKKGNCRSPFNYRPISLTCIPLQNFWSCMLFIATYLNISRPITYFAAISMVSEKKITHVIVNSSPQLKNFRSILMPGHKLMPYCWTFQKRLTKSHISACS